MSAGPVLVPERQMPRNEPGHVAGQPALAIDRITKTFGHVVALRGVTFDVAPGEVVGLVGDNGAGKSTLVKIIAGVQQPTAGSLRIGGREVVFRGPADARAAGVEAVYQDLALVEEFDVAGTVVNVGALAQAYLCPMSGSRGDAGGRGRGWTLELVRSGRSCEPGRMTIAEIGKIDAPSHVEELGLGLTMSQELLGRLQQAIITIQEAALKAKAAQMRADDPTIRLKDHRLRSLQTLFGTVSLRVPRLSCAMLGREPPVVLAGSSRPSAEYDRLRAKFGAWMSYRAAAALIAELFPLASGRHASTVQQQVLR